MPNPFFGPFVSGCMHCLIAGHCECCGSLGDLSKNADTPPDMAGAFGNL
jgi:hypothetical protein